LVADGLNAIVQRVARLLVPMVRTWEPASTVVRACVLEARRGYYRAIDVRCAMAIPEFPRALPDRAEEAAALCGSRVVRWSHHGPRTDCREHQTRVKRFDR
jgi:hypothetical protein